MLIGVGSSRRAGVDFLRCGGGGLFPARRGVVGAGGPALIIGMEPAGAALRSRDQARRRRSVSGSVVGMIRGSRSSALRMKAPHPVPPWGEVVGLAVCRLSVRRVRTLGLAFEG